VDGGFGFLHHFFYDQCDLGVGNLVEMPLQALEFALDIAS
jgi:hypothetical protein